MVAMIKTTMREEGKWWLLVLKTREEGSGRGWRSWQPPNLSGWKSLAQKGTGSLVSWSEGFYELWACGSEKNKRNVDVNDLLGMAGEKFEK